MYVSRFQLNLFVTNIDISKREECGGEWGVHKEVPGVTVHMLFFEHLVH